MDDAAVARFVVKNSLDRLATAGLEHQDCPLVDRLRPRQPGEELRDRGERL